MNLTKSLKETLVDKVVQDQLGEEKDTLFNQLHAAMVDIAVNLDGGLYKAMEKLLVKQFGKDVRLKDHINFQTSVYLVNSEKDSQWSRTHLVHFGYNRSSTQTPPVMLGTVCLSLDKYPELAEYVAKLNELGQQHIDLIEDLYAILNSVRTVKKLQELTNVFDPFLPSESKSFALVPTEPLLRVNALKSPKHKAKAAA